MMAQSEVNTQYGRIRGSLEKSSEGIDFYAFKGIPYAKPPVGELRFKVTNFSLKLYFVHF